MTTFDKTSTSTNSTEHLELAGIDTAALDAVSGGCAACGQSCPAGAVPPTATSTLQNPFDAFGGR